MVRVFLLPMHVLGVASKPTETRYETLGFCVLLFRALYARPTKLLSQLLFSSLPYLTLPMRLWNPLDAPAYLASLIWQQHLRSTVPFCVWELLVLYLGTGYYTKIKIAYDPDHVLNISDWVLWVLDVKPAEL